MQPGVGRAIAQGKKTMKARVTIIWLPTVTR